ncbi:MAG: signal recognition particle receptor subunit alpha [Candidatus Aenigmatarchaeota archaeon]|jgi:signal recognition particle subunit SRP54
MLENFSEGLKGAIRKIIGKPSIDEKAVEEFLKDLRVTFLQADVDIEIINSFIENVRKKVLKEKIPPGFTLRDYLIKVVYDELVNILGKEASDIKGKKIMLVGLYGSGKTTSAGKIAYFLKKRGKVALVCLDYHRPAAADQIKQIAEKINVKYFIGKDAFSVAKESLKEEKNYDYLIYDTAGRDALDEELAKELKELGEIIKPDEVLLVLPAEIGKVAKKQAEEFNKLVGITGIIVTKMDSSAKGGAVIAACSITNAKIKFIGTGEKIDAFEKYDPKRFVSRILGLGDLETLLEKAKEVVKPEKVEKIVEGDFTLEDFLEQIEAMKNIGPLSQIVSMIPGLGLPKDLLKNQEEMMKKWKYIYQSMTPKERKNPEIIDESRIKRIAKGSGTKEEDVRNLLENYFKVKKMIKSFGGIKGLKRGQLQNLMKQFGIRF